jgi:anti-sigma factor RsiW
MSPCDENDLKTLRCIDNELSAQELADFRAHLGRCADCRVNVETQQALSRVLRRSRPLYSAPAALRARVAATVEQHFALAACAPQIMWKQQ